MKLISRRKQIFKLLCVFCAVISVALTIVLLLYDAYIFAVPFVLNMGYWILVWRKLNKEVNK